jgi:hypothetical protein
MKKIKHKFIVCFILLACFSFITCENPIIAKWWYDEDEEEFEYVGITRTIYEQIFRTETVYERIIE